MIAPVEKVKTLAELEPILELKRHSSAKVVFTNGCFDLLHVGHVRYLLEARRLGDLMVVGINSDASVRRLKGDKRPIVSQEQRAEVLASFYFIDYVVIFDDDTPIKLIEAVHPDFLVKGGDWAKESIVGADFVEARGGQVKNIVFVDGMASTNIIGAILSRYGGKLEKN